MTDGLSDERLAQIRACSAPPFNDAATQIVYGTIQELLAEVDRLKAHLQVSFGASEALCENANSLDADCRRLRDTAAEMLAAIENDTVTIAAARKWREAIWPLPPGWSIPSAAEGNGSAAG